MKVSALVLDMSDLHHNEGSIGIANSLKELLADEDGLVRERAAKVLGNIARE